MTVQLTEPSYILMLILKNRFETYRDKLVKLNDSLIKYLELEKVFGSHLIKLKEVSVLIIIRKILVHKWNMHSTKKPKVNITMRLMH